MSKAPAVEQHWTPTAHSRRYVRAKAAAPYTMAFVRPPKLSIVEILKDAVLTAAADLRRDDAFQHVTLTAVRRRFVQNKGAAPLKRVAVVRNSMKIVLVRKSVGRAAPVRLGSGDVWLRRRPNNLHEFRRFGVEASA